MPPSTPAGKKEWSPPLVFAEYQLLWLLGRGGMGEVYLGHDKLLDRPVAIKFISTVAPDDNAKEQYLVEARAAARLQHPNVVTVHRVGEIDGRLYIVAEYIRGQTLESVTKPLPWQQALELGVRLCRGLAEAHRRGVLHRDIKPGNAILADNGEIKLLDFGLAKCIERSNPMPVPLQMIEMAESTIGPTLDITDPISVAQVIQLATEAANGRTSALADTGRDLKMPRQDGERMPRPGTTEKSRSSGAYRRLNFTSSIKGTPMYMAPEVMKGLPATARSDVYSMGALLFELCAGVPPYYDVAVEQLQSVVPLRDAPPLCHIAPAVDPRFAAIIDRCLRRSPADRFAGGEQLAQALDGLLPSIGETVPEGNPFRGLWAFESDHHALFFGRRGEISTLLDRLRSESCVFVAGESGLGKTSLCQAGLLPLVSDGLLEPERTWKVASMAIGRQPLRTLSAALAVPLGVAEDLLIEKLRAEPTSLSHEISSRLAVRQGLVLFVDQLDELVSVADSEEANIVALALGSLLGRTPGLRLVVAARSHLLARISALPGIGEAATRYLYNLRPMSAERLREAIVGPAQAKGVQFEGAPLINQLVESTVHSDGGLSMLQLTLAELWEARDGNTVTSATLQTIGGVGGALARHADHVIGSMLASRRQVARRILCALVAATLPIGRRSCTEAELFALDATAPAVIELLVRARLVHVRSTPEGAIYELAHAALTTGWPTLQRWILEQQNAGSPRPPAEKPSGGSVPPVLGPARLDRRLRYILLAAALFVVAGGYGGVEFHTYRGQQRRLSTLLTQGQRELSLARNLKTVFHQFQERAFAAAEQQQDLEAERQRGYAHNTAVAADRAYGRASHQLEAALNIDGGRADLRDTLADILYERALTAEADRQESLLEDLLQRLALYDLNGERRQRWQRQGRVTLTSNPPQVNVQVMRYSVDAQHHYTLVTSWSLGTTPIKNIELDPGHYVIVLKLPGYETLKQTLIIDRAAEISKHLSIQKSANAHIDHEPLH